MTTPITDKHREKAKAMLSAWQVRQYKYEIVAQLLADKEALEKDKERLDWLEKTKRTCLKMANPDKWVVVNMGNPNTGVADTLRTAIDAAIEQEKKV